MDEREPLDPFSPNWEDGDGPSRGRCQELVHPPLHLCRDLNLDINTLCGKNGNLRFRPDFHHLVQFALLLLLQCLLEDIDHPVPVWLRNVVGRRAGIGESRVQQLVVSIITNHTSFKMWHLVSVQTWNGMICCDEMSTGFVVSDGKYFLFNSLFNSMCKSKF